MFDNRKAPHVHNKSVMCNFIFIQSILLSHCELNTFFFLQRLPHFSHHKRETVGDKGGFSFNKLCFSAACEKKHVISEMRHLDSNEFCSAANSNPDTLLF